jgi:hypothetical protein
MTDWIDQFEAGAVHSAMQSAALPVQDNDGGAMAPCSSTAAGVAAPPSGDIAIACSGDAIKAR